MSASFRWTLKLSALTVFAVCGMGCSAPVAEPREEAESSAAAVSAVDVACTANATQIGLGGAGAATAVAGYITAAIVGIEALGAAGAETQLLNLGRAFSSSLLEIGGATSEVTTLVEAVAARQGLVAGQALAAALLKLGTNGNVRGILTIGYAILVAVKDGLLELDRLNPIGIQRNLDYVNDGLRFACNNCGEQWACPAGVTASRMVEFDPTRHQENDTAAISTGRDCAASTTFWSSRSYLVQCYTCCDGAGYDDSEKSGFHACRAVCNAAYK